MADKKLWNIAKININIQNYYKRKKKHKIIGEVFI